jgi:flavin-dependent dehydrogenase
LKKDLIIIGAGPTGSSASYLAAKAGLDVLILEKEKWPAISPVGERYQPDY